MASKSGRYVRDKLGRFARTGGGVGSAGGGGKGGSKVMRASNLKEKIVNQSVSTFDKLKSGRGNVEKLKSRYATLGKRYAKVSAFEIKARHNS